MLMLVDGVRLNDAQSGHHNGDIPVPLDQVERIEILYGPGSSLFGADAVGGTINIVTRRDSGESLLVQGGSFGLVGRTGASGLRARTVHRRQACLSIALTGSCTTATSRPRSCDREPRLGIAPACRCRICGGSSAPTTSTVVTHHRANGRTRRSSRLTTGSARSAAWSIDGQASYRTHGDRFVFNQLQPALSDNRHRTHAVLVSASGSRPVAGRGSLTVGLEGGGDWIRSTNLGDHATARISAFGEWRQEVATGVQLESLLRVDMIR